MARLAHLTDIHFGGEDAGAAEAALHFVNAEPPDLTIVTGDLTLNGLPSEFRSAQNWLERLPKPLICTPGNHDTPYWNIPLRAFTPFNRYRRYIGPPGSAVFESQDISARLINTARGAQPRPDWSKGAINLQAAQSAAEALAASPAGALRVIGCHHPLIEAVGSPVTGGVHRGDVAAERFASLGVDLILTGHVHNPFAVPLPFGDGCTYAVGGGTLSLRTRGTPPSFNMITIDHDCVMVVAMAWTGSHLEPYRTWSLDRRKGTVPLAPALEPA